MTFEAQEEEAEQRAKRVGSLCGTIEAIAEAHGRVDDYVLALAICAGMVIRRCPNEALKGRMLHDFLSEVRRISKAVL
jgi:hypothetical protein